MPSPSALERLAGPGRVLAQEDPDAKEFGALVRSGLARLRDAEQAANSLESRFDLAYCCRSVTIFGIGRSTKACSTLTNGSSQT
jgi:hypothetical protein